MLMIGIRQFFTRQNFPNPDSSKFSTIKILRHTVIFMYCYSCVNSLDLLGGGIDYGVKTPLNVTFPAGATCASFDVTIINDELSEKDEQFEIIIMKNSLPFGVIVGGKATVTIEDNDGKFHNMNNVK